MTAYRQDTLSSSFVAGRTAAPGWKPGTGWFIYAIDSTVKGFTLPKHQFTTHAHMLPGTPYSVFTDKMAIC